MAQYRLVKRIYFPDGKYADPQEARWDGVSHFLMTNKGSSVPCSDSFIQSNIVFFELIEKKYRWWVPNIGQVYFYVSANGLIERWENTGSSIDLYRIAQHNCFKTETEAEIHKEMLELRAKLYDMANWVEGERWSITCGGESVFVSSVNDNYWDMRPLFASHVSAQVAIKEIGEDNLIKLFKYKW